MSIGSIGANSLNMGTQANLDHSQDPWQKNSPSIQELVREQNPSTGFESGSSAHAALEGPRQNSQAALPHEISQEVLRRTELETRIQFQSLLSGELHNQPTARISLDDFNHEVTGTRENDAVQNTIQQQQEITDADFIEITNSEISFEASVAISDTATENILPTHKLKDPVQETYNPSNANKPFNKVTIAGAGLEFNEALRVAIRA